MSDKNRKLSKYEAFEMFTNFSYCRIKEKEFLIIVKEKEQKDLYE